ncbi:hypothetical protein scyTo_0015380 [Scyliorhinus torazame]|uniref:Serine aminopeptidase S33 domain-containing protein n=1 Tax=Scyliorhinus torazame TaxID=75743 RepID=A0A401PRW0_SCYTO|nr:hypothetical protein [Scyliorhinus torazame]
MAERKTRSDRMSLDTCQYRFPGLPYRDLPHFVNADGDYIFCRYWEPPEPPRALVMIIHGAGEHSGRYAEVVTMLLRQSLFVFSHDHDRRNRLCRFTLLEPLLCCLDILCVQSELCVQTVLCVQTGGLMAIYVVHERPDDFAGVIFVAPLVLMNPESATPLKVKDYIADPLNYHGPVRVRFATVLLKAVTGLEKVLPTVTTRMLLLHGDADKLCDISGSYLFYDLAASTDKTLKVFQGSFHQLHKELTVVTEEMFELIEKWLNERLSPAET